MYVCIGGVRSSCVLRGVFRKRLETLCLSDGILCLSELLRHCTYVDVDSCGGTVCVIFGFGGCVLYEEVCEFGLNVFGYC